MSSKGLERLINESKPKEERFHGDQGAQERAGSSASPDKGPRKVQQARVKEFPRGSYTGRLKILRPSTWFSALVERAAQLVRRTTKKVG